MSQLTLNLPDKLAADLVEASRQSNRAPDELAVELLKRALAVRSFKSARDAIASSLGDRAPETDDDAFKLLP
jgi:hypothetical protein